MSKRETRKTNKQKQAKEEDKPINKQPEIKKRIGKTELKVLEDMANLLRIDSIRSTNVTKSGHPTSCASIAEIMACVFFNQYGLRCIPSKPDYFLNDRFVLSKGHAAPILYSALARAGFFPLQQILHLRKKDALLQGHPVPSIPFVDVATGSLGMGLGFGAGMAYSSKYYDKIDNRVYVLMGDGQVCEGSIWESAAFASYYKLNNLIGILDINGLGQSDKTMYFHDIKSYAAKFAAFGWQTIQVDGHNCTEIVKALKNARQEKVKPVIILANTFKGKGLTAQIQAKQGWHGKALGGDAEKVINALLNEISDHNLQLKPIAPEGEQPELKESKVQINPSFPQRKPISTRKAYGQALLKAYECNNSIVGLDGDTKNSTFSQILRKAHNNAHIQCFIAEQNMVEVGIGISTRQKIPFISTFGAFFSRAADMIRIGGLSQCNFKLVGSHCGVSIGEDGPSQMALQDLAFMRTIPNLVLFYPSDGVSAYKAVELAANYKGPVFIRTSRPDTSLLYPDNQSFEIGKCKVVKKSAQDKLLIVSSGITLHEAIKASNKLEENGIKIRVIDLFSLKPVDSQGIATNAAEAGNIVLTIEDHYPEGGIHDLVSASLSLKGIPVHGISVQKIPGSASPQQQLQIHGLDSQSIVTKVKQILKL